MAIIWDAEKTTPLATFSDELTKDRFAFSGVRSVAEKSLAGTAIVFEDYDYNPVTVFQGTDKTGTMLYGDLMAVFMLSRIPNAQYLMEYHGEEILFRFANENPPAVVGVPVQTNKPVLENNDRMHSVAIKIMEM